MYNYHINTYKAFNININIKNTPIVQCIIILHPDLMIIYIIMQGLKLLQNTSQKGMKLFTININIKINSDQNWS